MTTQTGSPPQFEKPPFPIIKPSGTAVAPMGICIYGDQGAGKTTLAGTLEGRGILMDVVAWEGRSMVLSDKFDRIDPTPITTWRDIDTIYDYLAKGIKHHGYRWVAIDSFTALQDIAIRRAIKERPHGIDADPKNPTLQEWGYINRFLLEFVYQFQQLPMIKLYIAQEGHYAIEGIDPFIGPATRDKVVDQFMEPMWLIGRLWKEDTGGSEEERRLLVSKRGLYKAKYGVVRSRSNLMPKVIRDPNLEEIIQFAYGNGAPPKGVDPSEDSDGDFIN